jgi:uncharacterized protein YbjQ (UPF0145 family)
MMPTMPARPRFRDGIPVSTSNEIPGWQVTEYIGEVFGLVVRSRGAFPQLGANLNAVFGGELKTMTTLLRETREDAVERLVDEAEARGADGVIAMRFDMTSMGDTAGWDGGLRLRHRCPRNETQRSLRPQSSRCSLDAVLSGHVCRESGGHFALPNYLQRLV